MAALDACEPQIIRALEKDGWRVIDKPFTIRSNRHFAVADFSMQRAVNGRSEQIVVLEVKCFLNPQGDLQEFYTAVGQYLYYRTALILERGNVPLYLAVPMWSYERLTKDGAIKAVFEQIDMKFVIVDIEREEVIRWIT